MSFAPPASIAALPASVACRLEELCTRFEHASPAGQSPAREASRAATPEPAYTVLLGELLALELAYRARRGERPQQPEYHARFPDHAPLLHALCHAGTGGTNAGPAAGGKQAACSV